MFGYQTHGNAGKLRLPGCEFVGVADIGIQEMPSRAQHTLHFGEETADILVVDRGFDIDHGVEGLIWEGQALGVALHEVQAGQVVPLSAEFDADRVQIQRRVGGRAQGPHQVRSAAAVAATDLQYLFADEIHLRRRAMVELDGKPVRLIGRRQRQRQRRILLISVVEEQHVVSCEQAAEQPVTVIES